MSVTEDPRTEPYLRGLYAPVHDEVDLTDLEVTGELPAELRGSFLRNGPNPMFAPTGPYHLFDGDGMIHELAVADGRATYRNRWIRSRGLLAEQAAGRSLYGGMAHASFPGPDLVGDAGPMKNVANTHVVRHAGEVLCLWEAGPPTVLDAELATLGTTDFGGRLAGSFTAHPKIDPDTGEMFAFGYSAIPPYLRYHVIDADGTLTRTVDIDLPAPVMMHDFAVTDRHALFLDAPAVFDLAGFAGGGPMISWQPERGTRLGVMSRDGDGSDLRWIPVEDCYVFHFLNAYSLNAHADGDRIVVDACRLPRMDIGLDADAPPLPAGEDPGGYLTRFTVDLTAGTARHERLAELTGDFPRIDDGVTGRRHRYGYVATFANGRPDRSVRGADGQFDSITAYDLERGTETSYVVGAGRVVGEPVVATAPSGVEGEGWVMSYVHDRATDRSALHVLSASDVAAGPVATIQLPRRVPFGFHGSWLPA
jgi:carotenoid cleavage dioxygenase